MPKPISPDSPGQTLERKHYEQGIICENPDCPRGALYVGKRGKLKGHQLCTKHAQVWIQCGAVERPPKHPEGICPTKYCDRPIRHKDGLCPSCHRFHIHGTERVHALRTKEWFYDQIQEVDDHWLWLGHPQPSIKYHKTSPRRHAFYMSGVTPPRGNLKSSCGVRECIKPEHQGPHLPEYLSMGM